jgi:hypothetical protein
VPDDTCCQVSLLDGTCGWFLRFSFTSVVGLDPYLDPQHYRSLLVFAVLSLTFLPGCFLPLALFDVSRAGWQMLLAELLIRDVFRTRFFPSRISDPELTRSRIRVPDPDSIKDLNIFNPKN